MHHIVTTADTRFFHFALTLVQNLYALPNVRMTVYDLGLTKAECTAFARLNATVERIDVPADSFAMNSARNIRAVHKLDCIQHFLQTRNEGMILLDADTLVLDPACLDVLKPAPDEVVVTYRCRRENKPHILINGKINTGVMAFGSDLPSAFFDVWRDLCRDSEHTDQSALSVFMEENGVDWARLDAEQSCSPVRVRVLDGEVYNDTSCRVGQIFHFKSAGRRLSKLLWYRGFAFIQRLLPGVVRYLVGQNRRRGLFVWKPKAV